MHVLQLIRRIADTRQSVGRIVLDHGKCHRSLIGGPAMNPQPPARGRPHSALPVVPGAYARRISDLKDTIMKLLDLAVVLAFFASLVALAVAAYFVPRYALPGIMIIFVVFGGLVLLIRRANRPTSARIAAMRIRH